MSNEITFLVAFATVYGASEAIKQIQSDARKKEHRSRKNNLIVRCLKSCEYSSMLEGRRVVLSGDKVCIPRDFPPSPLPFSLAERRERHENSNRTNAYFFSFSLQLYVDTGTHHDQAFGHPFAGYYLPYPESNASGLVSTICDEPPIMNWIYVDRWSYELKFGNRAWADDNWPVPWDCSRQDRRLTFGGWEGFLAVKEGNFWALYFDIDEDHLKDKVPEGTPVLEIELQRIELRVPKPQPQPQEGEESEGKDKDKEKAEGTADANGVNAANGVDGQQQSESGPDKADGSTCQNGAYMTPPEEPLEGPPVD